MNVIFKSLTGLSGWSFYCALVSIFGLAGYSAEAFPHLVPPWAAVALLVAPLAIVVLVQWGELPDRVVAVCHGLAAFWFMVLAVVMEIGILHGDGPRGAAFYRVLTHLGWTFAWADIYRRVRNSHEMPPPAPVDASEDEGW